MLAHQTLALLTLTWCVTTSAPCAETKPKYGPEATPLSRSHEFFQRRTAPDFWALIPYYMPQQTGGSCSVAAVAMVVNAARYNTPLGSNDKLVSEAELLNRVKNPVWKKGLGLTGHGITLDQLGPLLEESLKSFGITPVEIETVHVDNLSGDTKTKIHRTLIENERSNRNFIIANFLQGSYTGDAEVGHWAAVGAYDSEKKRVLIMDPDREWYEPYWVNEEAFLKGMNTLDKQSSLFRGFIRVTLPELESTGKSRHSPTPDPST